MHHIDENKNLLDLRVDQRFMAHLNESCQTLYNNQIKRRR